MNPDPDKQKGTQRILIIEDDLPTLESAVLKFTAAGFEVETATDGLEGLEKIRERGPVSAVLLDLRMPRADGFSFLEEKRKDDSLRDIPVVIFSNIKQDDWVERARRLGVKRYLLKANVSLQEVVDEIKKLVTEI